VFCALPRYVANLKTVPRLPGRSSEVGHIIIKGL
jgi:hypothetical protein